MQYLIAGLDESVYMGATIGSELFLDGIGSVESDGSVADDYFAIASEFLTSCGFLCM